MNGAKQLLLVWCGAMTTGCVYGGFERGGDSPAATPDAGGAAGTAGAAVYAGASGRAAAAGAAVYAGASGRAAAAGHGGYDASMGTSGFGGQVAVVSAGSGAAGTAGEKWASATESTHLKLNAGAAGIAEATGTAGAVGD